MASKTLSCALAVLWLSAAQVFAVESCNGRYATAASMIDKAYEDFGTLYSGGGGFRSLGPTLEIYRALRGMPYAGFTEAVDYKKAFRDPGGNLHDPSFAAQTLARSLPRIEDPEFRRDTRFLRTDNDVLLNIYTSTGPYPGWWLAPDAPQLTPTERVISSFAHINAMDWLLTIQAASADPHNISWTLRHQRDGFDASRYSVYAHALTRNQETNRLEWFVAAALTRNDYFPGHRLPVALDAVQDDAITQLGSLQLKVENCVASDGEYMAFAIGYYEWLRLNFRHWDERAVKDVLHSSHLLPSSLRNLSAAQMAKLYIADHWRWTSNRIDDSVFDDLIQHADHPGFASWLNVGRTLHASSINDLIALHKDVPLHRTSLKLINLLSAEDLLRFARSRDAFPQEKRLLLHTAFLRFFALGQDERARDLVSELISIENDADIRSDMQTAWQSNGALGYRLAKFAETLRFSSVRLSHHLSCGGYCPSQTLGPGASLTPDLPLSLRSGRFVETAMRDWMQKIHIGDHISRFDTNHLRRFSLRGQAIPDPTEQLVSRLSFNPFIYERGQLGLVQLAAWNEIAQLGPETGLSNRIGREIIGNAARRSWGPKRFLDDDEKLGAELETVIRRGRRMIHGKIDGIPLGQAAFKLLHNRFSNSEAAARTRYWYICRERCIY